MQKRLLAILAMIATVFAFGVGSALAQQPEAPGASGKSKGCEQGDPPDCDDGQPGYGQGGDGNTTPPEDDESPLKPLCDALGEISGDLATACLELIGEGGEDPGSDPEPQPGPQDLCDGIRENAPELDAVASGCDDLVGQLHA